jgi:class 3 adenylate cyclase
MSTHLDDIIAKQHGSTNASVVFLDIVKYSKRKSIMQEKVLRSFNCVLADAVAAISSMYVTESQKQNLNLSTDVVKIPTGDGAAIAFPFQGLQNIHLEFALNFLQASLAARKDTSCQTFDDQGWCNCHEFFDVRVGVAEGKVIVSKDINGNYNVAGNTVNMANRVMGFADRQQIIFTDEAFKSIIDMTEDVGLETRFTHHGKVQLKHDLEIEVSQYTGAGENYLNKSKPIEIELSQRQMNLRRENPIFQELGKQSPAERLKALEITEILKEMPIPAGFLDLFSTSGKPDIGSEKARKIVEAFKMINGLMQGNVPVIEDQKTIDQP